MRLLGTRAAIGVAAFVAGVSVVAGVAYAAIPNSGSGIVTACYPTSGSSKGVLRVVDAQAGAHCGTGQATLTWPGSNFRWRGQWTGTGAYLVNDVVRFLGSAYIAVKASTNVAPSSTTSWALMASAGAPGTVGLCGGYPHVGIDWSMPGSAPGHGCDFTGSDLEMMNLSNANLTNANFTGANMVETRLAGANISGAVFDNLGSVISGGGITGVPLALPPNWIVAGGYLVGPADNLMNANLAGVNLTGANFVGDYLNNANLSGANLTSADLSTADAESLNLSGANLTGANLTSTLLTGATFTGAIWKNTTCPDGTNSNAHGNTCINNLNYG